MKIIITRSFERTRQIADFVPIKAYCAASIELSEEDLKKVPYGKDATPVSEAQRIYSASLDDFVQSEVDKTLASYYPQCIVCGGKGQKMSLNKEGVCGQCVTQMHFQAAEFAREKDTNTTKVATKRPA